MKTPWPKNPGAYLRFLIGLAPTGLLGALATTTAEPATVAAFAASAAGDLGLLFVREHDTPLRRHLKTAATWTGTAIGALALAWTSYEGTSGLSLTLGHVFQLDPGEWAQLAVLAIKSGAQTGIPNLPAVYPDVDAGPTTTGSRDVVAPVEADLSGHEVVPAAGLTGMLPVITDEMLASHAGAVVPAQASAPQSESPELAGAAPVSLLGLNQQGRHEA